MTKTAHFSCVKGAHINGIDKVIFVDTESDHSMAMSNFAAKLRAVRKNGVENVIVILTCGTTMIGAHDNIAG